MHTNQYSEQKRRSRNVLYIFMKEHKQRAEKMVSTKLRNREEEGIAATATTTANFKDSRSMYRCLLWICKSCYSLFLFQAYDFCLLDTPLSFHPIVFEQFRIVVVTKTAFFSILI